jgi:Flp pilus assembly protein TadG
MSRARSTPRVSRRDDRGTVTAFAVVVATALVLCLGLVIDAGRLVDARVEAGDLAAAAARAGAQEITDLRGGRRVVHPARAEATARAFLAATGVAGQVASTPSSVTVTVQIHRRFTVLGLAGLSGRTVRATRTASPVSG